MKLKRANTTEVKKAEREFRKRQEKRARARAWYARTHKPCKSKKGKRMGRPRKRKNEKFEPARLRNGETRADLLTHVRYPLMKSPEDWTDFQREEMRLLFESEPKMKVAYGVF